MIRRRWDASSAIGSAKMLLEEMDMMGVKGGRTT